jgi:hypothetical protein
MYVLLALTRLYPMIPVTDASASSAPRFTNWAGMCRAF